MKIFRFLSVLLPIYAICAFCSMAIIGNDYVTSSFEKFLAAIGFSYALIIGFASIPFMPILRILSSYFDFRLGDGFGLPTTVTLVLTSVFLEIIFLAIYFLLRRRKNIYLTNI